MGLKNYSILCMIGLTFFCSCKHPKAKSDIEVEFIQDTLTVGYTYWWPQSGPFIGNCGDELSLVCAGVLIEMGNPNDDPGPLYKAQEGTIALEHVYKIKDIGENTYSGQKYVKMDCFDGLDLAVGDTVLVFCYDYEDNYSVPGDKSILKVLSFEDPLIASTKRYIDTEQNPKEIIRDTNLWAGYGLKSNLKQILECNQD